MENENPNAALPMPQDHQEEQEMPGLWGEDYLGWKSKMNDLAEINDRLTRIEKLLERICPPVEQISVADEVRRIKREIKRKEKSK